MSTLETLNNGESGLIQRGKINDNFTELNTDKIEASDIVGKEDTANKGVANGYAPLGADGIVPSGNLPSAGSGDMLGANNLSDVASASASRTNLDVESSTELNARDTVNRNVDNHTNGTTNKVFTATEQNKLTGIEANATADQTGAEIKVAYEGETNTNGFTDAEKTKLAGLDSSHYLGTYASLSALNTAHPTASAGDYANVDAGVGTDVVRYIWDNDDSAFVSGGGGTSMTDAEVKIAYENNADTNAFTDSEKSKLTGIEAGATADQDLTPYVDNTSTESIGGVKTYTSSPIVPAPTTDLQVATKKYVDDNGGNPLAVLSDTTGVTGADRITNTMSLTQAEYDAITTPDASTQYIITDADASGGFTSSARAYVAGNQTLTTGVITKVTLNTESYDIDSEFDSTTNYRFTATDAGRYQINGAVHLSTAVDNTLVYLYIYVNGVSVSESLRQANGTGGQGYNHSDCLNLSASDYVELYVRQSSGSNKTLSGSATRSYMSIARVQ